MRLGNLIKFVTILGAVIGARSITRMQEESESNLNQNLADKEFEDALENLKINFKFDKTVKESKKIKRIISTTKSNIMRDIRSSVYDRQVPRGVMLKCIEEIDIEVLDLRYSKKTIEQIRESTGSNYGSGIRGEYDPEFKKLVILNEFDGKHSMGIIIHECTHLYQHANEIEYDKKRLSECISNLKKLGIKAAQCLDDVKRKDCDPIKDIAQNYKGRTFITKVNGFATVDGMEEYDPEERKILPIKQLGDYPLKKRAAVVSYTPGLSTHVAVELEGVTSKRGGDIKSVSKDEKLLFQMEEHLGNIPTVDKISSIYPSPKFNHSVRMKEVHAALVERVHFPLIDKFCEDLEIPPSSTTKTREPTNSLKKASKEKDDL